MLVMSAGSPVLPREGSSKIEIPDEMAIRFILAVPYPNSQIHQGPVDQFLGVYETVPSSIISPKFYGKHEAIRNVGGHFYFLRDVKCSFLVTRGDSLTVAIETD
ncbi:hypothetical protein STEG23_002681, partial [Scotinomys teguina]